MLRELVLAAYIMSVGLCISGAGTHLYQMLAGQQAMLRYDGKTLWHGFGNLAMSFFCGPYIMLQLGWRKEQPGESIQLSMALVAAFVAFGWSFITGLLIVGTVVSIF